MLLITEPDKWIELNPAKASQGIQRLLLGTCFSCGHDDRPVEQVRKSLAVSYFICDACRLDPRFSEKELREESERLMLVMRRPYWKRKMTPMLCPDHNREELTCRFCKKNQLRQDAYTHEVPIMCEECWQRTRQLTRRTA